MTEIYETAVQIINEQMGTSYTLTNDELILIINPLEDQRRVDFHLARLK